MQQRFLFIYNFEQIAFINHRLAYLYVLNYYAIETGNDDDRRASYSRLMDTYVDNFFFPRKNLYYLLVSLF
jgi:hypothetical protein